MCSGRGEDGYADLQYVRRRYITKDQLRASIAGICNAIFRSRKPEVRGEGTTACASIKEPSQAAALQTNKGDPDRHADLQPVLSRPINWKIIERSSIKIVNNC